MGQRCDHEKPRWITQDMILNTTHIKNLAIALEALSRINSPGSTDLYIRVENLLKDELKKQERRTKQKYPDPVESDEIPF